MRYPDEEETSVFALNVTCSVYPSNDDDAEEQIGRVVAAMDHLVESFEPKR